MWASSHIHAHVSIATNLTPGLTQVLEFYRAPMHLSRRITVQKLEILLMEEILHQLRLVVYPIIYKVLYIPGGWQDFGTINSIILIFGF